MSRVWVVFRWSHRLRLVVWQVTILEFSPKHAISYNLLADVVSRNLLTSDWYDPDHEECMLNTNRNSKWAREMMNNIKKSCCVAGNCDIVAKPEDIKESLELLLGRHSGPSSNPSQHLCCHFTIRSSLALLLSVWQWTMAQYPTQGSGLVGSGDCHDALLGPVEVPKQASPASVTQGREAIVQVLRIAHTHAVLAVM